MERGRAIAIAGSVVCGIGLILTALFMSRRVHEFHEEFKREVYAFEPRVDRHFTFAGREVRFEDDRSNAANQFLNVKYGDASLHLRVTIPGEPRLPDMLPHEDWLRILRFGLMTGRTMAEFRRDLGSAALPDRVVIVTRTPRPGADPRTWGEIWMKDWVFDFYELKPEGGFSTQRLRFPTNRVGQPMKEGELRENTWQFQAALQLMPQSARERIAGKTTSDAMGHLGWTLPVSAVFGVGLIISLGFAGGPKRRPRSGITYREGA